MKEKNFTCLTPWKSSYACWRPKISKVGIFRKINLKHGKVWKLWKVKFARCPSREYLLFNLIPFTSRSMLFQVLPSQMTTFPSRKLSQSQSLKNTTSFERLRSLSQRQSNRSRTNWKWCQSIHPRGKIPYKNQTCLYKESIFLIDKQNLMLITLSNRRSHLKMRKTLSSLKSLSRYKTCRKKWSQNKLILTLRLIQQLRIKIILLQARIINQPKSSKSHHQISNYQKIKSLSQAYKSWRNILTKDLKMKSPQLLVSVGKSCTS